MRKAILALAIIGTMSTAALADVAVNGNFGYRYDNSQVTKAPTTTDSKIAAEVLLSAKINDSAKAVIGIATGDAKTRFASLGDNNSLKGLGVDLAYVDYAPLASTKVTLGKMYQPWAATPSLFLDKDIHPEGAAVAFNAKGLTATAYSLKVAEGGVKADSTVTGFEVGFAQKLAGLNTGVHFGLMNHDYFTNTSARSKFDLRTVKGFVGSDFAGKPVRAFVDYSSNNKAATDDKALAYGVTFGNAKAPGSYDLSLMHQKVEKNALPALWVDNEFAHGNAQNEGNAIKANYVVAKGWKISGTYYDAKAGLTRNGDKHLMIDLKHSF